MQIKQCFTGHIYLKMQQQAAATSLKNVFIASHRTAAYQRRKKNKKQTDTHARTHAFSGVRIAGPSLHHIYFMYRCVRAQIEKQ